MASADKNSDRSHTRGDSTEPAEPLNETASREKGLKHLLTRGLVAAPGRLSLETQLGIFTIVILVFTFGFLVYRKVDLHHQRLTQAAIGPQAPDAALQASLTEPAALLNPAGEFEAAAALDSSLTAAGQLPATGFTDVLPETAVESGMPSASGTPTAAASGATAASAPMDNGLVEFQGLLAEPAFADASGPTSDFTASGTMPLAAPAAVTAPELAMGSLTETDPFAGQPADRLPSAAESASTAAETTAAPNSVPIAEAFPQFGALPDSPAPRGPELSAAADASAADDLPGFAPLEEPVSAETISLPTAAPQLGAVPSLDSGSIPSVTLPTPEPQLAMETGQLPDFTADAVTAQPTPAPGPSALADASALSLQPSADAPDMLLALAEPQQNPADNSDVPSFDGGFLATEQESAPAARAPQSSETLFPELGQPSAAPQLEPEQAPAPESTAAASGPPQSAASPFDTTAPYGLQPSPSATLRSTPPQRVSRAMATEADGKFSLAAFNYQHSVPPPVDDGNQYEVVEVQKGDNYSAISKRMYGTIRYFSALAVFNQHRIPDPRRMRPGMKILVPPKELLEERYPQLFPEAQSTPVQPPGFVLLDDGSPAFRVGGRETLSEIAERFLGRSARWTEIYELNQSVLKDPNKLRPGLLLALPADAVEVNVAP